MKKILILIFCSLTLLSFSQKGGGYFCVTINENVSIYENPNEKSKIILNTNKKGVLFKVIKNKMDTYFMIEDLRDRGAKNHVGYVKKTDVSLIYSYSINDLDYTPMDLPQINKINNKPSKGEEPKNNCILCPTNGKKKN